MKPSRTIDRRVVFPFLSFLYLLHLLSHVFLLNSLYFLIIPLQKVFLILHSSLDKDFNTVYLVFWSIFCVAMSESEELEPFPGSKRVFSRRFPSVPAPGPALQDRPNGMRSRKVPG
jgi:hypothetical protein